MELQTGGLTRRRFMEACAAGGAMFSLAGLAPLEAVARATEGTDPALRRSGYGELGSSAFEAVAGEARQRLELVAVEDLPIAAEIPALRGSEEAFSVRLRGEGTPLEAGTWRLQHPQLGEFSLFVSPIGAPDDRPHYQAIVDRSTETAAAVPTGPTTVIATPGTGAADGGEGTPLTLRAIRGRLSADHRRVRAAVELDRRADSVTARLMRGSQVVARTEAAGRGSSPRLRLVARRPLDPGRYTVHLAVAEPGRPQRSLFAPLRLR